MGYDIQSIVIQKIYTASRNILALPDHHLDPRRDERSAKPRAAFWRATTAWFLPLILSYVGVIAG